MTQRRAGPRWAYCANVLPAPSLEALREQLGGFWADVRRRAGLQRLGIGLWLPDKVAHAASRDAAAMRALCESLAAADLDLVTVNAFPASAFHASVVKEAVYRPAWTEPARFAYTSAVARTVAGVVDAGSDVPISTLPIGHPKLDVAQLLQASGLLLATVLEFHRLRESTGTTIRLALEPEPTCCLETAQETIEFFASAVWPFARSMADAVGMTPSAAEEIVRRHLGVCLDLCHAAVLHEDPVESFELLRGAGVPVFKVQVSAALDVPDPADPAQRSALEAFVEPRWLHQVGAADGRVVRDLPDALAAALDDPSLAEAAPWRVHFHVPLHATEVAGLPTTRPDVERFLAHVATLDEPPVLELETYTWSVVPGAASDLAANVASEIAWFRSLTSAR